MEAKIMIKTPKGKAQSTQHKISPFILGLNTKPKEVYVSPDDDCMVWVIEGDIRRVFRIQKNAARFAAVMEMVVNNKFMRKTFHKHLSEESVKELREMLLEQTSVEVITDATVDELAEYQHSQRPLWQRVKETFKKI